MQTGSGGHKRVLYVLVNTLDADLINVLPSLHAISGCDSVSAVHGMGKIKWLSTVQNGDRYLSALSLLGSDLIIEQTTFETIEKLFFSLYGN